MNFNTERARKSGKLPDRFYYQLNGKTAQENYDEILQKRREQYYQQLQQEKEIKEQLDKIIKKEVEELIKGFLK